MLPALVIAGSILQLAGTSVYIKNTLFGKTKPNRVTFLVWTAGPLIGFAASVAQGWSWALLPVFISGFGPLLVLLASFVNKKAYWKLGALDYICGVSALTSLVLWQTTSNPDLAIFFAIIADALALTPTLIKSWNSPDSETGVDYVATVISVLIGLAVARTWTFHEIGFLLYLVIADGTTAIFIYRRGFFSRFKREIMHWGQEMEG